MLTLNTAALLLSKDKVVPVGDFKLPDIDCKNSTASGIGNCLSNNFFLNLFENNLFQHVMETLESEEEINQVYWIW